MGAFSDLGGGTHIVVLTPRANRTTADVEAVLEQELLGRVGAGPFRAGNVERVEVYRDSSNDDRLVVLFSVDIGTSPSLREALTAVAKVARTRVIASAGRAVLSAG
jgi:hypothetical protein